MYFKKDLELGKKVEHLLCDEVIKKKYPKAYVVEGYNKGFDIFIPEQDRTVEVKYDVMSAKTGNYMIETSYGGEPSGIETTTANWWVQIDDEVSIWVMVETLRYLLRDYREISMKGIGDSKEKVGYLIPRGKLVYSPYTFVSYHSQKFINLLKEIR